MAVKDRIRMTPGLSSLPGGQRRAVLDLIGGELARTYPGAAKIAGTSLGTMHTHVRRVRQNHPKPRVAGSNPAVAANISCLGTI